ncbi:MAG: AmmeMemoRadiSam system radical SAM enzyme [Bowdeniella nasicola]|nr:AmmeMemoRadiSam system radical SAM enzyme [Bowdeniella nasicola]
MAHPARWWRHTPDGRVRCELCPRTCTLREGQRGFCFVRRNEGGHLVLETYGRSTGFAVDPIEKKPLNHVLPGARVLSFGTAGCNLGCRFCQNWEMSTSRRIDSLSAAASPTQIAALARRERCAAVAFTYNDPVIFAEYAIDTAHACRAAGIAPIAVSAGYISAPARAEFFAPMAAANIDLKAFTDEFYRKVTGARLEVVLDTLVHVQASETWLEITTLLISGVNDSSEEIRAMSRWIVANLGPDVPHHFSAFHPDHRMRDRPPTPPHTLTRAREIALECGQRYVYTGNVVDPDGQATICPSCQSVVIERDRYHVGARNLTRTENGAACGRCGQTIPGLFFPTHRPPDARGVRLE